MAGGYPYGVVPYGGVYPPGAEPPLNATVVTISVDAAIEPVDPLSAALLDDHSRAEFAAVLRAHFLGDSI